MTQMTVAKYQQIKAEFERAKAAEMSARLELVQRSGHLRKGSKTLVLDGFKLQIVNPENVSIYAASIDDVREKLGEEKFLSVFKIKYDISSTGLKALSEEDREIAEEAIVTSSGTSQLKIVKEPEVV